MSPCKDITTKGKSVPIYWAGGGAIAGIFVSNIASNNVIVRDRIIGSDIRE
jgi:hypothetical protein